MTAHHYSSEESDLLICDTRLLLAVNQIFHETMGILSRGDLLLDVHHVSSEELILPLEDPL